MPVKTIKTAVTSVILLSLSGVAMAQDTPGDYWENETIFEENKEPGHATYTPYRTIEAMRADADFYARPTHFSSHRLLR